MMLVLFFNYDQVDQFQRLVREWVDSLPRPHPANLRTSVQNELDRVLHQMDLALNVGSFLSLLDKESGALRNQVPLEEMVHSDRLLAQLLDSCQEIGIQKDHQSEKDNARGPESKGGSMSGVASRCLSLRCLESGVQ